MKTNPLWKPFVDITIFFVIILFFHFLFKSFASFFTNWSFYVSISSWLEVRLYNESTWIIQNFLYDIVKEGKTMFFENDGYQRITSGCSGIKQFYQYFTLILLFPGPWKKKLWFIPMGIFILHITNVFRIVIMSVVLMNLPDYWDFAHDWVLRPFFYVVIFALWWIWNDKIRISTILKNE